MTSGPTAKLPFLPTYTGPPAAEVAAERRQHLSAGQYLFYREPLMLVEGAMQYVFDDGGRRYLDCYSNVCHVGHCHPHVVNGILRAAAAINSNTRYLHPTINRYAAKLKAMFPPELDTVFFVNSGSEANDLAIRLARVYTQRRGVLTVQHAYHGTTAVCAGLSTCLAPGTASGCVDSDYCARDVHVTPQPNMLRGPYRASDPDAVQKYLERFQVVLEECKGDVAAFIHETIQGVAGQFVFPPGYLKAAYDKVRRAGGVCIADEVQVGFGRTGATFWAFEAQGVVPDIVTLGKPIGNGFPLAAVVVRRHVAAPFDACQYFNTFGGSPVACAAGLAVLEALEADGLQANARLQGDRCLRLLRDLQRRHPRICDVRGAGLFIGVELATAPGGLEPAPASAEWVFERCRQLGVLIGKGGPHNNVLRIKPPLCVTAADIDLLVAAIERALREEDEEREGRPALQAPDVDPDPEAPQQDASDGPSPEGSSLGGPPTPLS